MNKEKLLLIFGAAFVGIIVASVLFFVYQSTKKITDSDQKTLNIEDVSNDEDSSISLIIDEPKDEAVVDVRTIKVIGKTEPNSKILVVSQSSEEAGVASNNGNFSMDISLSNDENIIEIIAVTPEGEVIKTRRIVTFSTQDF